jgi:hypothetical protein
MSAPSKKALFILHEGISSTIFNSQVLEHAKRMKDFGVEFDILAYDTLKKTWKLSNINLLKFEQTTPDVNIILNKAWNIYFPFSLLYNLILLIVFFIKNKEVYSFVQSRADYTTFLCILVKPFHKLPVYWDCRGDTVSELKDSLSRKNCIVNLIGNLYLVNFDRFVVYINCKKSDGAIFVSEALFNLFRSKLKTKNYKIIPCPVSERKFFFDSELRLKMRSELGITNDKLVYLYSGSMIAYQSLYEQYKQYELLLKNTDNIILIATSEPDVAKCFFENLISERLIITSVSFEEMNAYYNLADFAFLIRERKQLNFVASPTKFGEYCLTGLPVIMNNTVDQAFSVSKKLGNYVSHSDLAAKPFSDNQRMKISDESKQFYSRQILSLKYVKLYNL